MSIVSLRSSYSDKYELLCFKTNEAKRLLRVLGMSGLRNDFIPFFQIAFLQVTS